MSTLDIELYQITFQEVLVQPVHRKQIHTSGVCTSAQGPNSAGHLNSNRQQVISLFHVIIDAKKIKKSNL